MATISENLVALNEAKQSIKSAIESKGQDLTGVPFTEYGGKIEAIQTGGKELPSNFIMTSLPNGLAPTTTFISSKGELFASNANTGLWYYDKTAEQWINSFEYTGSYGSVPFWEDSNGNIFTRPANNHLNHIRLFDFETKTFSIVDAETDSTSYSIQFFEDSLGELFASSGFTWIAGIQKFNKETRKFEVVGGANKKGYSILGEDTYGNIYVGGTSSSYGGTGLCIYNRETGLLEEIYDDSFWGNFYVSQKGEVFLSGGTNKKGFIRYNPETKVLTQFLGETGLTGWFSKSGEVDSTNYACYFYEDNGSMYFNHSGSTDKNLYYLEYNSDTVQIIYSSETKSYLSQWQKTYDNKVLISGLATSTLGIFVLDTDTKTVEKLYEQGCKWKRVSKNEKKNTYYITSTYNGTYGILEYDGSTITQIFQSSYTRGLVFVQLDDNWGAFYTLQKPQEIISGNAYFYKIDLNTNTVSQIDSVYYWDYIIYKDEYYFMPSSGSRGFYRYRNGEFESIGSADSNIFTSYPVYLEIREDGKMYGLTDSFGVEYVFNDETERFETTSNISTYSRTMKDVFMFRNTIFKNGKIYGAFPMVDPSVPQYSANFYNQENIKTYVKTNYGIIYALWSD